MAHARLASPLRGGRVLLDGELGDLVDKILPVAPCNLSVCEIKRRRSMSRRHVPMSGINLDVGDVNHVAINVKVHIVTRGAVSGKHRTSAPHQLVELVLKT